MALKFNPIQDNRLAYLSNKYASQGVTFYFVALVACTLIFMQYALPFGIMTLGIVSILLFFIGSQRLGKKWACLTEKRFINNVLIYGFSIRLIYVVFIYFYNQFNYNHYYESNGADLVFYVPTAIEAVRKFGWDLISIIDSWSESVGIPDQGYMLYLTIIFNIMGAHGSVEAEGVPYEQYGEHFVWLPLLLKCVYGAITCVLMYRIAQRHFGENIARMTALFCMLQMNMIWWCGSMMKETEMVLLGVWFVERMDRTILGIEIRPTFIIATVLLGLAIFTVRSALFMTSFAATILALVLTRTRTLTTGKKVVAGVFIVIAMALAMGDNIIQEVNDTINTATDKEYQKTNMEWRMDRKDAQGNVTGNQFAKYASAVVFAPLIFTIPFPNMVYINEDQEMLMMVNGGNFEKNILSFFIIFAMFQLLLSGQWRRHVLPLAYYVGYLAALVLSVFAQSGRFHMPIMPFAMMFGAYGLTLVTSKKHKQWFSYAMVAEVAICIFWSWFKLAGRGLV